MPKTFTANFSDLSGPTNPKGILSPRFMVLKQALDRGDDPDNILQALSDWMSEKGVTGIQAIVDMEPEAALEALVQKIGGGLDASRLPPAVLDVLRRTVKRVVSQHIAGREASMEQERGRLMAMRQRFQVEAQPERIVDRLLES